MPVIEMINCVGVGGGIHLLFQVVYFNPATNGSSTRTALLASGLDDQQQKVLQFGASVLSCSQLVSAAALSIQRPLPGVLFSFSPSSALQDQVEGMSSDDDAINNPSSL